MGRRGDKITRFVAVDRERRRKVVDVRDAGFGGRLGTFVQERQHALDDQIGSEARQMPVDLAHRDRQAQRPDLEAGKIGTGRAGIGACRDRRHGVTGMDERFGQRTQTHRAAETLGHPGKGVAAKQDDAHVHLRARSGRCLAHMWQRIGPPRGLPRAEWMRRADQASSAVSRHVFKAHFAQGLVLTVTGTRKVD